jgi:hypothetical protein
MIIDTIQSTEPVGIYVAIAGLAFTMVASLVAAVWKFGAMTARLDTTLKSLGDRLDETKHHSTELAVQKQRITNLEETVRDIQRGP